MSRAELLARVQTLEVQLAELEEQNRSLQQRNAELFQIAFGCKTERRVDEFKEEPNGKQGWLFLQDLLVEADRLAQETGAKVHVEAHDRKPRKQARRRDKFPEHLHRVITKIELPEEQRLCCGQPMQEMGEQVHRELERVEFSLVHETRRKKYACRSCQEGVRVAPAPSRVIDKGILGVGFLAHVLNERFGNHQPYHRLEKKYEAEGLDLSRAVLCQSALRCAELLEPIWKQIRQDVLRSAVVHTDETPVNLQKSSEGGPRKARVWIYLDKEGRHVYDFTETRSRDGPENFFEQYQGYIQADAASTFDHLYLTGGAKEVACWAHARRYFVRAEDSDQEFSREAVRRIRELFRIEREATEAGLDAEERRELRQQHALPRLEELRAWIDVTQTQVLPKSPMGKEIQYCINQWDALKRYVEDGRLFIDNNAAERALRAVAVGRKNWVIVGNQRGGQAAAILYSLVMTCKAIGVQPADYFRDVLLRINQCSEVEKLTPHGWKQHFGEEVEKHRDRILDQLLGRSGPEESAVASTAAS